MRVLGELLIAFVALQVVGANRFGYSKAEQRLWKKKHEVRVELAISNRLHNKRSFPSTVLVVTNLQFQSALGGRFL
jgi:hypothetical protein